MIFAFAFLLLLAALALFWQAGRKQSASGLPAGRVIYADTGAWARPEKPLYDPASGLTGKPDYLVRERGVTIPVEVKSSWAPETPYWGHILQLACYCWLVEKTSNQRPPYGILHYRNRTFAIDYTAELEAELVAILEELRQRERRGDAERSHDEPARCARCGYRSICDQRL